jgi:DNA-3-methyladenine glycosylase II
MARRAFALQALPPFRLDLTVWALRRRPGNTVDRWDGHTYRRVLALAAGPVELAATQAGTAARPRIEVELSGARLGPQAEAAARAALARVLGLDLDLSSFYRLAERDPLVRELAARFRGLKPPRFPTLFECLVNAIACQQLTLTVGILLLNRLAEAHGAELPGGGAHAFPRPADLAPIPPETLMALGFSRAKARSIVELAAASTGGGFVPAEIEAANDTAAIQYLRTLRGVGRWSAEYALLRGLGRLHVFPGDDVGARNNLARRLRLPGPLDYPAVERAVRPWQPFAGLVYFHLLLAGLAERETIEDTPPTI